MDQQTIGQLNNISIDTLQLSTRSSNGLKRQGIFTLSDLAGLTEEDIMNFPQLGAKSLREILDAQKRIPNIEISEEDLVLPNSIPTKSYTYTDEFGTCYTDIPLGALKLSARAYNCLTQNGYSFASELIGKTEEDFLQMRNMGAKTASILAAKVKDLRFEPIEKGEKVELSAFFIDLIKELTEAYHLNEKKLEYLMRDILNEHPDIYGESVYYLCYERDLIKNALNQKILRLLDESSGELSRSRLDSLLPKHLRNTTIIDEALLTLEMQQEITSEDLLVSRRYMSAAEYVESIENERHKTFVKLRIEGKTLEEIGELHGLTRERVRQVFFKAMDGRPFLEEDKYLYLFEHYSFSLEDFCIAFGEPESTYHYLCCISKVKEADRKEIDEVLNDASVSEKRKRQTERAIFKNSVCINGMMVSKKRPMLIKLAAAEFCKNKISFDEFIMKYHEWLKELGIGDDPNLQINGRTYENHLNASRYILWNQWKSMRYYNIDSRDYEALIGGIGLMQYHDVELSTYKFFRDYPELMEEYDIRDEYELHNLLKKLLIEDERFEFSKMPTLKIGNGNAEEQSLELMIENAPIDADQLGQLYEDIYGVKKATIISNTFKCLNGYYHNKIYTVSDNVFTSEEHNRMVALLTEDFYSIKEITAIYLREFPGGDKKRINPQVLKSLGFKVFSGYVIKSTWNSATEYFDHILLDQDITDISAFDRMTYFSAYSGELSFLRAEREIVEFSRKKYINIRRLNEMGITKENLQEYCNAVRDFVADGEYFTIESLRSKGFTHPLEELGFEDTFYASLLAEDKLQFRYCWFANTRIFCLGTRNFYFVGFLEVLLQRLVRVDFYELLDLLKDFYGIKLDKEKLMQAVHESSLYYDSIMEAVYRDYDTYFEEI